PWALGLSAVRVQSSRPGVSVVQTCGGLEGSAVLRWVARSGGRGALLTGDTISVLVDDRWVTFIAVPAVDRRRLSRLPAEEAALGPRVRVPVIGDPPPDRIDP